MLMPVRTLYSAAIVWMFACNSQALAAPPTGDPLPLPAAPAEYVAAEMAGGPPKDGIPSIDDPVFWNAAEAGRFLEGNDIVFGVYRNGRARAYPQRVLVWHEIVNDDIGDEGISVTYCPLTGTAMGFLRGDTELGVSGRLVNSNMIMYDRATNSFFPQILATGIQGPMEGRALAEFRVVWTTWERWRERHPETQVLSSETGFARNYRRDPYGQYNPVRGYYRPRSSPMFPTMNDDRRFPPKRMMLAFRTADLAVAIDRPRLEADRVVTFEHDGRHYHVIYDSGLDTGWVYVGEQRVDLDYDAISFDANGPNAPELNRLTEMPAFDAMWFAWAAFYPETRVIRR
jgi:hypothetical protein